MEEKIIIVTSDLCEACNELKKKVNKNKIKFVNINDLPLEIAKKIKYVPTAMYEGKKCQILANKEKIIVKCGQKVTKI